MFAGFLFVAFTSYLFTWQEDQDKVHQFGIKIFAEKTIFSKYKLRFEAEGLSRNRGSSKYYIYNDHIRFSDLKERQDKFNRRPIELRVSIQGTF